MAHGRSVFAWDAQVPRDAPRTASQSLAEPHRRERRHELRSRLMDYADDRRPQHSGSADPPLREERPRSRDQRRDDRRDDRRDRRTSGESMDYRELKERYDEAMSCIGLQKDYIGELEDQVALLKKRLKSREPRRSASELSAESDEKERVIERLIVKNKQLTEELTSLDREVAALQGDLEHLQRENARLLEQRRAGGGVEYMEDLHDPIPPKTRNQPNRKAMVREIFDCHGMIAAARKSAITVVRYAARTSDIFEEADRVLNLVNAIQDKLHWVVSNCFSESEWDIVAPQSRGDDGDGFVSSLKGRRHQ